jgi:hypothetical protein
MSHRDALSKDELVQLVQELLQVNAEQQTRITELEAEIVRLRSGPPPSGIARAVPSFVKPNRPAKEKRDRKPRKHSFVRLREEPTRVEHHFPERCSCGQRLSGGWLHDSRQIIDIPETPVEVIEHRFMACRCGVCGRRSISRPDLSCEVLGRCRLGVRLMSLIAYMDTVCRTPVRTIQEFLKSAYGLRISVGEIVEVLHKVASVGQPIYDGLLSEVRRSEVLHADETGLREDGVNGYVWSLSTPDIRYYHRDKSRGAGVIQKLLGYDPQVFLARTARGIREARARDAAKGEHGERFRGVLVSDFYAAYSWYGRSGEWHQRCLVHLCRDLDQLKSDYVSEPAVCQWVEDALGLIQRARASAKECATEPASIRRKLREAFEKEALALSRPYCRSALPQNVLAKRIFNHRGELFVFVQQPDVPPDNNAAERAIRPQVVLRKMSGGTRSQQGSDTQSILLSLFGTWALRGADTLAACRQMLSGRPALTTA